MSNQTINTSEAKLVEMLIVVINYLSADLTKKLVKQINSSRITSKATISVICVDNSVNQLQESALRQINTDSKHPFKLIVNSENQGFGNAINTALNGRSFDFACLINPDVTLLPGTLDTLLTHALDNPKQGIWGGITVNESLQADHRHAWQEPSLKNTLGWAIGLKYFNQKPEWHDNYTHKASLNDQAYSVDCVSGSCLLISASAWQAITGFDPNFFLYSEEVDLCRRARESGFQPTVIPHAKLIHCAHSQEESNKRVDVIYSAKLHYARKHHGLIYNALYRSIISIGACLRAIKSLFLGQFSNSRTWAKLSLKALFSFGAALHEH